MNEKQYPIPYETTNELVSVENIHVQDEQEQIAIHGVDLNYEGKSGPVQALQNITFNIFRGEFVCVLGPSGCGKSTLLKIIAGFIPPTAGSIRLDGEEIKGTDWHRGVVFQNPPLYDWFSVRENVAFGPKMRGLPKKEYTQLADEYLDKVGLSEFADKKIYELSGGMKQRVSIARALVNNPEILLMDEPFGALDALTRETVQDLTRKIWWESGKTIFFITHDVEEALLLGSRVIVLSKHPGRVIADIPLSFSRQIAEGADTDIKFTPEFYTYREKLLRLINRQGEET
ncbi:ABC transporter ATP-binding protein [Butyricicoccus sp.]|uniref:ABC transporter ATP-binding protein n=1 Tax=Butyricicoccus sp. TaxID=2049021 RepID=UPI003D7E69A4